MPADERFWRHVIKAGPDDCWLWTGGNSGNGYGRFRRGRKSEGMIQAHVFSYELHNGPIQDGLLVLHRCDVRGCVNPKHLFVGDQGDNVRDCVSKGRMRGLFAGGQDERRKHGSDHKSAKLTEIQIPEIRMDTRPYRIIASDYGVDRSLVGLIKRRRVWKHV